MATKAKKAIRGDLERLVGYVMDAEYLGRKAGAGERKKAAIRQALAHVIDVIDAAGGVHQREEERSEPQADREWTDLGAAYVEACRALGREPLLSAGDDNDEGDQEETVGAPQPDDEAARPANKEYTLESALRVLRLIADLPGRAERLAGEGRDYFAPLDELFSLANELHESVDSGSTPSVFEKAE